MIGKGNHHAHGVKLGNVYLTGHPGERAELIEMRGFGPISDLRDGFRVEHIRARDGTKAEKPFFHVQFRGAHGEGLKLTTAHQLEIANRCDSALGLVGQPRAASLHINRQTGDAHLHLGYSLVAEGEDGQLSSGNSASTKTSSSTCHARSSGISASRSSATSGSRGKRPPPTAKSLSKSRRLGSDGPTIRAAILDCLEKSDGGKSLRAALDAQGLMLANGDRRDCFVVIDQAGGHHALNKKLTSLTLAAMRDRLADLDRSQLPGVEQAQAIQAGRHHPPEAAQEARQRPAPEGDRETRAGAGAAPPVPEKRPLGQTAAAINAAWTSTRDAGDLKRSAEEFARRIEDRGLILVYVTDEEARASARADAFAKAVERQNRALREGFAVVDQRGNVTRIDQRVTGDLWHEIEQRLAGIDRTGLLSVAQARDAVKDANRAGWAEQQQAAREKARAPSVIEARIAECAEQARLSGAVITRDGEGRRMSGAEALADRLKPDGERAGKVATVHGPEAFAARLDEAEIAIVRATAADITALAAFGRTRNASSRPPTPTARPARRIASMRWKLASLPP